MNELLQQWLDARLLVPGMIACGVATHETTGACRSADANFPPDIMTQILKLLQTAGAVPGADASTVRWHTWIYTNGKIRCATRPDGWTFAAAVRANSDAAQILDPLTEEFLALKEGA
ncbi:MAG TPA: hypothetical protein VMH87_05190 [Pseudomonadales bacterium]|nr:hypothetical protein [Pseudomonadales bacterium]